MCAVCSNVELGHGVLCEVGAKTRDADGNRSVLWQSKLAEWIDPDISEHHFRLPMYHFHPFPAAVISMTLTKKKTVACTDPSDPTSKSCGIIGFQDSGVISGVIPTNPPEVLMPLIIPSTLFSGYVIPYNQIPLVWKPEPQRDCRHDVLSNFMSSNHCM